METKFNNFAEEQSCKMTVIGNIQRMQEMIGKTPAFADHLIDLPYNDLCTQQNALIEPYKQAVRIKNEQRERKCFRNKQSIMTSKQSDTIGAIYLLCIGTIAMALLIVEILHTLFNINLL